MGFDYAYDKDGLYDKLRAKNLDNIRGYIQNANPALNIGAHFIENHDEGHAKERFGNNSVGNAAGLIAFTLPGMRFHFMG